MSEEGCNMLRLRGLPYSVALDDIYNFFEGYEVAAAHLIVRGGKPTGEAYVQFKDDKEAARALKLKQREHIGNRYIELFEAGEANLLAQATGVEGMPPALDGRLVRMRGLPFTSTAEDVLEFLRPAEPVGGSHGVVFACTPDGRPTGEAYMEFSKSEDHQHALTRHKELLGTRYIEVFDSTKGELYYIVHQRGFFTSVGGYRMHHPPLPIPGDESNPYPPMSYATRATRRDVMRPSESAAMEAMTKAFSSFGPSRLDRQVPGPRRPPASGGHQRGGEEARYAASAAPAPWAGVMPGPRPPLFNPAPGPSGAGSAAAAAGSRGPGQVGPMPTGGYDYTRQQAVMINPFMMQHPFMPQQAAGWGYLPQPQGNAWFGGRPGGVPPVGMPGPGQYHHPGFAPAGYYPAGQHPRQMQPPRHRPIPQQYQHAGQQSQRVHGSSSGREYQRSGAPTALASPDRRQHSSGGGVPAGTPHTSEVSATTPGSAESSGSVVRDPQKNQPEGADS